ncbi:MAG: hypothetical protein JW797_16475 [Bradymonadales bacterium]|nr:hypothetical protein [Bradymonadales bacterium]
MDDDTVATVPNMPALSASGHQLQSAPAAGIRKTASGLPTTKQLFQPPSPPSPAHPEEVSDRGIPAVPPPPDSARHLADRPPERQPSKTLFGMQAAELGLGLLKAESEIYAGSIRQADPTPRLGQMVHDGGEEPGGLTPQAGARTIMGMPLMEPLAARIDEQDRPARQPPVPPSRAIPPVSPASFKAAEERRGGPPAPGLRERFETEDQEAGFDWKPPSGVIPLPPLDEAELPVTVRLDVSDVFPFPATEAAESPGGEFQPRESSPARWPAGEMDPLHLDIGEVFPFAEATTAAFSSGDHQRTSDTDAADLWRLPGRPIDKTKEQPGAIGQQAVTGGSPLPKAASASPPEGRRDTPFSPREPRIAAPLQQPVVAGPPLFAEQAPAEAIGGLTEEPSAVEMAARQVGEEPITRERRISQMLDDLTPLPEIAVEPLSPPVVRREPEVAKTDRKVTVRSWLQTVLFLLAAGCLACSLALPFDASAWVRVRAGYFYWFDIIPAVLAVVGIVLALPRRVPAWVAGPFGLVAVGFVALVVVRSGLASLLSLQGEAAVSMALLAGGCLLLFVTALISLFSHPPHRR